MSDLESTNTRALNSFAKLKKAIDKLPQGDDYEYVSVFETFSDPIDSIASQLLACIGKLCPAATNVLHGLSEQGNYLEMSDIINKEIESGMKTVENCIDCFLEGSHSEKKEETLMETQFSENSKVPRPKLDPEPDNTQKVFSPFYRDNTNNFVLGNAGEHPYEDYTSGWPIPQAQLQRCPEIQCPTLEEIPFQHISTVEGLEELSKELKMVDEFAVDLEHHQYHSYFGLTCLMQLSTRKVDYIIDVIALRKHMWVLKDAFLSPSIVKIFHGAAEDIKWLQRDFGLYVCNMFDTGIALQRLRQPRRLGYLLKFLCGVSVDKAYQLADWRIRPLSDGMLQYAREDTHYLIFCYLRLRNMLAMNDEDSSKSNLLKMVWEESRQLCLTLYGHTSTDEESCDDMFFKHYSDMDAQQISLLRELFQWRDAKCRELDESWHALLPNGLLARVAKQKPLNSEEFHLYFGKRKTMLTPYLQEIFDIIDRVVSTVSKDAVMNFAVKKKITENTTADNDGLIHETAQHFIEYTGTLPSIEGFIEVEGGASIPKAHSRIHRQLRKDLSLLGMFCDA